MPLLIAFIVVPMIEIFLFYQVGVAIGIWWTLGIVLVTAILGTFMVRTQGAQAIANLRGSLSDLRDPTEHLAHGAMILVSGVLLLTPGFFTDAVGFALLIPGVRGAAYRYLRSRVRVQSFEMGGGQRSRPTRSGAPRDDVIEGDFTVEPEQGTSRTQGPSGWTRD